jgi:hypothetical protein
MIQSNAPKHPKYILKYPEWERARDCFAGEECIKTAGPKYLKPTYNMVQQGCGRNLDSTGQMAYDAYKMRAEFPEYMREAVQYFRGLLWKKDMSIILPDSLGYMLDQADNTDRTLLDVAKLINKGQLISGRVGVLLDINQAGQFYLATYDAEKIINWGNNFWVLDESDYMVQPDLSYKWVTKTRYLKLINGTFTHVVETDGTQEEFVPQYMGKPLDFIPFLVVASEQEETMPATSPLQALVSKCLALYRLSADYKQSLFMQGQDTLVITTDAFQDVGKVAVGAGNSLILGIGSDAKYVGVNSSGLSEQRLAIEKLKAECEQMSGKLVQGTNRESGEALTARIKAQASMLIDIARNAAAGLEVMLRYAAMWSGANPDDVQVVPNVEFADSPLEGQELLALMNAKSMGAPLSLKSIHTNLLERGLTDFDYETEMEEIENETAAGTFGQTPSFELGEDAVPNRSSGATDGDEEKDTEPRPQSE